MSTSTTPPEASTPAATPTTTSHDRSLARVIGILFIIASVSAIVGGTLILPAEEPDAVLTLGSDTASVVSGVLIELLLVVSAIGIAALLFPVLKRGSEGLALAYLGARIVEGGLLTAAAVSAATIVSLHRGLVAGGEEAAATSGQLLVAVRQTTYPLGGIVAFGVSALILNWLLYRSRLVPAWLSLWGLAGGALVLARGVWELYGAELSGVLQAVLTAPIGINEMVLAVWLIAKGFTAVAEPATRR